MSHSYGTVGAVGTCTHTNRHTTASTYHQCSSAGMASTCFQAARTAYASCGTCPCPATPFKCTRVPTYPATDRLFFVYIYSCFATLIYLDFDLCVHKFNWFKNRFIHWCWKYFFLIHTTGLLNMTIFYLLLNLN